MIFLSIYLRHLGIFWCFLLLLEHEEMNLGLHVQQASALPLTIVPASIPDLKEDSQWQDWATGQHWAAQNRREGGQEDEDEQEEGEKHECQ